MRESFPLGRFAGVRVGANWSVLVILGLLTAELATSLSSPVPGLALAVGALAAAALFACVLAHELAHSVVARRLGMRVDGITLWALGGVSRLDGEFPSAGAQLRVAVAGPAVSVVLAVGFGTGAVLGDVLGLPSVLVSPVGWLAAVNGLLAVFNLLPAAPLDGGRVLAALLWAHRGDRDRATIGAARAGQVLGGALVGLGVLALVTIAGGAGLWPMLLGWFVLSTAEAERRVATLRLRARGLRVRDVMTPAPEPRPGWITVGAFLERYGSDGADAFVIERWEGGTAGIIPLSRLRAVAPAARSSTRVVELALPLERLRVVGPDTDLATAWTARSPGPGAPAHLAVLEHGRVIGIVTPEDVTRATGEARVTPAHP